MVLIMFNWLLSCNVCSKSAEIDRKLKELEEAERNSRIITWERLSSINHHMHRAYLLKNKHGDATDVEIVELNNNNVIKLSYWEAEILRGFLLKHYPIKESVNNEQLYSTVDA